MSDLYYCSMQGDYEDSNFVGSKEEIEALIAERIAGHGVAGILCGRLYEVCSSRGPLLPEGVVEDENENVSLWGLSTGLTFSDHHFTINSSHLLKYYRCVPLPITVTIG